MKSERLREDPLELMRGRFGVEPDNITYDPKLRKGDYSIIREQTHDGTFTFIFDMQAQIFNLLLRRESYHKPNPPDRSRLRDIHYTVGPLQTAVIYGPGKLPYAGDRMLPLVTHERYRLPVKVEYVYV